MDPVRRRNVNTIFILGYACIQSSRIIIANVFAARKLPCPGLMIIKQSTRHYNTGNLLEKRASAGNYDAPSPSTYVSAVGGQEGN